ncbi:MAG: polysaccharide biosynthesis/export family protein [Verrucomicrobia bacterium]|nr:polysaccharide biosynthesis/export family protein [Verrucomicrobiota bacterium]
MRLKFISSLFVALICLGTGAFGQIQAGRAIQISVSGVPSEEKGRIDAIYPVSESGMINVPFIGQVRAEGLRAEQLAQVLEQRFRAAEIYTSPTFQVIDSSAKSIEEKVVTIGGQVRKTGPVPFNRGLTLYQAIQNAGGPTEFGSMHRVKLYRAGKQTEYDLTKAEAMNILLESDDTIEVPQKNAFGR